MTPKTNRRLPICTKCNTEMPLKMTYSELWHGRHFEWECAICFAKNKTTVSIEILFHTKSNNGAKPMTTKKAIKL